ncbi:MAG: 16S rRNA (guanine(966)-N(2))-methyltransferase RsmD [Thermoleophilia bacterium]|nr:16S rRNA (guanine(966)-N(2))-methyltransferase RsmD [Thermoleophilia bacterium]
MRIVGGSRKGHRVEAPRGGATRPTSDRVREAVFSILGPVEGARCLDLFAGSGAMGLEALSRGARSCLFVERHRGACRAIRANLERLRLEGGRVRCADVERALRAEAAGGERYDLVLIDPPYGEWARVEETLARLLPPLLAEGARVVVETPAETEPALPLDRATTRRYGSARITVFER